VPFFLKTGIVPMNNSQFRDFLIGIKGKGREMKLYQTEKAHYIKCGM
jgi:hypothetical protein